MEIFPGSLALAISISKGLALVFGNDLQTGVLITLGAVLLLVGTLLRYKFPSEKGDSCTTPYTFWAKSSQSTGYMSSAAGALQGTSFNYRGTVERRTHRRPIAYIAMQNKSKTERRANLL
jgi:hypothetical protein